MYVNCQGALAIKIWPGIFILKNCEVHQNQKNGTKQPNGYILSAYGLKDISSTSLLICLYYNKVVRICVAWCQVLTPKSTISINKKEIELKISEDRQKEVRRQLCGMASGKAVIE